MKECVAVLFHDVCALKPHSQNWYVFSRWTTIKDLTCYQIIHIIDGHQWLKLPTFHLSYTLNNLGATDQKSILAEIR